MAQQLEINEFDVEFYFNSEMPSVYVETKNYSSNLNFNNNFNSLLLEAIDEGLAILGIPARNTLYARLERNFGVEKNQIPEHFDRFLDIMYKIVGMGVHRIETQILKILKNKLEIKANLICCNSSDWISQDLFKESVESLRQKYLEQFVD